MENDQNSKAPGQDSANEPLPSSPPREVTIEQAEMPKITEHRANNNQHPSIGMREFRLFEILSLAVNAVLLVVGIIALSIYGGQLKVMQGQLQEAINADKLARDTLIINQRPWLGMETVVIVKRDVPNSLAIKWTLKNYGNSPSLHSVVATDFANGMDPIMRAHLGDPSISTCKMGEDLTTSKIGSPDQGYTIFPGTSVSPQLQSIVTAGAKPVTWIGCITYLDQFTIESKMPTVHHSRFCYNFRLPLFEGETPTPCFTFQQQTN